MPESKREQPERPLEGISGYAGPQTKDQNLEGVSGYDGSRTPNQPGDEKSLHNENFFPTPPPDKWERRSYGAPVRDPDRLRMNAERETDRDLDKPLEQLACDIHETYLWWEKINAIPAKLTQMYKPVHLVLYALARKASMDAKVALINEELGKNIHAGVEENIKLQHKIEKLTKWLIGLTWVIAILTGGLFLKEILVAFKIIG